MNSKKSPNTTKSLPTPIADKGGESHSTVTLEGQRLPWNRYALFFLPLLIGATLDLYTKYAVFDAFYPTEYPYYASPGWIIEPYLGIQTSTNPGALFGIGKGYSFAFAALSVVVFTGILVWLFWWKAAFDRWITFALGLISGGIIGNFYDRVGWGYVETRPSEIRYHVRDWIYFQVEGVSILDPWPNFNIADSVLVAGAIMLLIHAFCFQPPASPAAVDDQSETGAASSKA